MATDGRKEQPNLVCMGEYYSAIKRSEARTPATMWRSLENVMPQERSPTQETTRHMVPSAGQVQNRRTRGDREQVLVRLAGQGRRRE